MLSSIISLVIARHVIPYSSALDRTRSGEAIISLKSGESSFPS